MLNALRAGGTKTWLPTVRATGNKRASILLAYRWFNRWSELLAAKKFTCKLLKTLVGPGEVPQPCDFNSLQCQTSLTALIGAKGILPRCKTMLVHGRVYKQVQWRSLGETAGSFRNADNPE